MSERKRVLIVDDDQDFVAGVRAVLDSVYSTEAAYNAKDGWEALQGDRYDLLCLDIMMGRSAEGVTLARKIGRHPVLRETPVLIITGLKEHIAFLFPGQAVHPGFVPVDELLEKPVHPDLLLQKVAALIAAAEERQAELLAKAERQAR
jgi:CheY-like chemotaxis protein